jgi:Zn-dependent protease
MIIAASFAELSPIQFLIGVAVAALLAMAVFAHASRHGSRHATAWGVATFLLAGIVVPVYFIRYLLRRGRS